MLVGEQLELAPAGEVIRNGKAVDDTTSARCTSSRGGIHVMR